MKKAAVLAVALILSVAFSGMTAGKGDAAKGKAVYAKRCGACHGPDGAGATPAGKATKARNLCSEEAKKAKDAEWTEIIVKGKNKMPAYDKKLTEAEIKDVIVYMRSLCKK